MESLINLVETKPYKNVTIQQITDNCGLKKRIFYYYFHDKFDLLEFTFNIFISKAAKYTFDNVNLIETVEGILTLMCENRRFFINASIDKEPYDLQEVMYRVILRAYMLIVVSDMNIPPNSKTELGKSDPNLLFALEFWVSGVSATTFQWIRNGMKESPQDFAQRLFLCFPPILHDYFE